MATWYVQFVCTKHKGYDKRQIPIHIQSSMSHAPTFVTAGTLVGNWQHFGIDSTTPCWESPSIEGGRHFVVKIRLRLKVPPMIRQSRVLKLWPLNNSLTREETSRHRFIHCNIRNKTVKLRIQWVSLYMTLLQMKAYAVKCPNTALHSRYLVSWQVNEWHPGMQWGGRHVTLWWRQQDPSPAAASVSQTNRRKQVQLLHIINELDCIYICMYDQVYVRSLP